MALSRPLLGIQSPIQCQLCQQSAKITCKCLECDLLMCSSCKNNVHPKIKTEKEHRIIDIKEIGLCVNKSFINDRKVSVDLNVVEEFQTKFGFLAFLAVSALDDSLWIGDGVHKKGFKLFSSHTGLQKVKIVRKKLQVISSFNIEADGISMTPNNELIIAAEGTRLEQIKYQASKITDTIYDCQPYKPLTVHVTRKNKVIVGGWKESDDTCAVLVFDHKGSQERVYGDDRSKDISFNSLGEITDTRNDNIFIIDTIDNENFNGLVKVLGLDTIIHTYTGHSDINTKFPFAPTGLATSPSDNVIIADTNSNYLHILSASGELLTYINTLDKGIDKPYSVCITMAGQFCILYIGTSTAISSKDNGKLYKLSIVGI